MRKIVCCAALGLGGALGFGLATPAVVWAQTDYVGVPPPVVSPPPEVAPVPEAAPPPEVLGVEITRAPRAAVAPARVRLPVTGGDVAGLVAIALSAIGTGTVLVRRSRRQATPEA